MDIVHYHTEFMQDIYARSNAENNFYESVFTERMCEFLVDQATIENYTYVGYKKGVKGLRVDAWHYNHETEVFDLFVADFRSERNLESLSKTDITKCFKRVENFFTESLKIQFHQSLEESTPGYELAREIYEKSSIISRVRFFLLSNANLSNRVESIPNSDIQGRNCSYDVWDISRLCRIELSGKAREDIVIDFEEIIPYGLPCLPAFTGVNNCQSYLLVMPGGLIASLYDQYGERLLEQNVRTFLQFRGKVNQGIRNTIQNEPEMFFAYNNGLTVTAESIETDEKRERIKSVTNLQIVNGGQTTASIFTAMKKFKAELSSVYVQVKLTVIPSGQVEEIVPRISQFANTQNKVSVADFFSNHPFHLRIEEMSRRLWAPSPEGGLTETHWFYERARGQYANAQANLTPAQQKEFLSKHPRSQMFTKTDLAMFENSMNMHPHIVSLGAQKNFANFVSELSREWDKNEKYFNEFYFKSLIAKAILFRFLDKTIMQQQWYGGYKANIITYSLAKLAVLVSGTNRQLDLEKIWRSQRLSTTLESQLLQIAEAVNETIQDTPAGITNVTEWCKKEACWEKVKSAQIPLSWHTISELVENREVEQREKDARDAQIIQNGIETQKYVYEKGSEYWKQIGHWGLKNNIFSQKEMGIIAIACEIPNKVPSDKQAKIIVQIEEKVKRAGFLPKEDLVQ